MSAADRDKAWAVEIGWELASLGFQIAATEGTAKALRTAGVAPRVLPRLASGERPSVLDLMQEEKIQLVVNTPSGTHTRRDEIAIRSNAILRGIPIITTEAGARATVAAIRYMRHHDWDVQPLQDYYVATC